MASDIKMTDETVVVEGNLNVVQGNLGVGTAVPARPIHVMGGELHSGGANAGLSFADRAVAQEAFPDEPGKRWVWYAHEGKAHLWSGQVLLTIDAQGNLDPAGSVVRSKIAPMAVIGYKHLGRPPSVACLAQDLILSNTESGTSDPAYAGDTVLSNFALSHMPGDKLVINRGGGYEGGVEVQGAGISVVGAPMQAPQPGQIQEHRFLALNSSGVSAVSVKHAWPPGAPAPQTTTEVFDLVAQIKALRSEVEQLKLKVGL